MTGTRIRLRRYSGCNLHWYAPGRRIERLLNLPRPRIYDPPAIWNRQRIYIPEEHYSPGSPRKFGRDKQGEPFVWIINDCGWEWLSTRPGIWHTLPLYRLFNALHEHVHTKHREDRVNVPLQAQRAIVTGLEALDSLLDRIPTAEVTDRTDESVSIRLHRNGLLGCRTQLANWSHRLDERWETGVWRKVKPYEVTLWADELSDTDERRLRQEAATDVRIDRRPRGAGGAGVSIAWTEGGIDATDALQSAQAVAREAGVRLSEGSLTLAKVEAHT